jgi:hypothetical protein
MKAHGRVDIKFHAFLTLALVWMEPRTGLDDVESRKILGGGREINLGKETQFCSFFKQH